MDKIKNSCFYLFQLIFRLTISSSHFQSKINKIYIQVKVLLLEFYLHIDFIDFTLKMATGNC